MNLPISKDLPINATGSPGAGRCRCSSGAAERHVRYAIGPNNNTQFRCVSYTPLIREEIFSQETESLKEQDFLISCQSLRAQFLNACCLMLASIKNPSICFVTNQHATEVEALLTRQISIIFRRASFPNFEISRFSDLQVLNFDNPVQNRLVSIRTAFQSRQNH